MTFYTTVFYVVASGLIGLIVGDGSLNGNSHASLAFLLRAWVIPTWLDLALIALTAVTWTVGFYFGSQAYRIAVATAVAPFEYFAVPLSLVWGYFFWGDLLDGYIVTGSLLIVGSGFYVLERETRQLKGKQ
jgi:drug/metabolite transporter (DMT)-like permease